MLWPSDPVRVDTRMQDFDRIERRPVLQPATQEEANEPQVGIDDTKTASVDGIQTSEPVTQSYNHLTWCTHRYRSYQPSDNSYMSFSGFKRECISPFSPATASTDDDAVYLEASAAAASFDSLYQDEDSAAYPNSDHIESCFSRYRSYRPEDNSYQPYGGGPRQQCQ
ncbi:MAG: BA14K family protein [Rhizobiaceae bacterium]|nr:BA14K family protein [Rhizobiaceae bacterium]